jgi:cobalt transporter subunit CbtB
MSTQSTSPTIDNNAVAHTSALLQKVLAIMFGVFIIGFAGFSHIDAVHNAAHDTRHSNAFPCH